MTDATMTYRYEEIEIAGMTCENCVQRVERALRGQSGVAEVEVTLGKASVAFYPEAISVAAIRRSVSELGYGVDEQPAAKKKGFMQRLREANERRFASGRPDCCTLNRDQ